MKVFGCKNDYYYGGGLILVTANSKEEAFMLAAKDDDLSYLFDWISEDGILCEPDGNINHCKSNTYPFCNWFEIEYLSADVNEAQIIVEDHYAE